MDKLKGNWACPWLTLPVASGNATETQDVLNNGLPEILAGLSDTWSLHPLLVADEVSGESSWQLVTAIPDNGDGLTLCEWHSEGLDCTHSRCASFGFFRSKRTGYFQTVVEFSVCNLKLGCFFGSVLAYYLAVQHTCSFTMQYWWHMWHAHLILYHIVWALPCMSIISQLFMIIHFQVILR
jgi:hypothetical protein